MDHEWLYEDASGNANALKLDPLSVCTAAYSERMLLVTVRQAPLAANFLVLHAPCSSAPRHKSLAFWKDTSDALGKVRGAMENLFIMADINGTLGSITSDAVGPCGADQETLTGTQFRSIV